MNLSFFFKKKNKTKRKLKRKTYRKKTLKKRKSRHKKNKKMKGGAEATAAFAEKRETAGGEILDLGSVDKAQKILTCYVCGYTYGKGGFTKNQLKTKGKEGKAICKICQGEGLTEPVTKGDSGDDGTAWPPEKDAGMDAKMDYQFEKSNALKDLLRPHKEEIIKKFGGWYNFKTAASTSEKDAEYAREAASSDALKAGKTKEESAAAATKAGEKAGKIRDDYYEWFYEEASEEFQEKFDDEKTLETCATKTGENGLYLPKGKVAQIVIHSAIIQLDEE